MVVNRSGSVVVGLVLIAAAGCQSGGTTLTAEEYAEQGNAICTEGNAEIMASFPMDATGPPSGEEGEALFQSAMTIIDRMITELDALEGPEATNTEMDAIVAEARAIKDTVEAGGAEAFFASEEDPWAAINPRFEALGLSVCASDPSAE